MNLPPSFPLLASLPTALCVVLLLFLTLATAGMLLMARAVRRLRVERDNLLKEKDLIFHYVQSIGDVFTESENLDTERLLQRVLYYSLRTTHSGGGAVYLLGKDKQLHAQAVSGVFPPMFGVKGKVGGLDLEVLKSEQLEELIRATPIGLGEGLIGQTADFGTPLLISRAELDPRVPHFGTNLLNVKSILLVPMRFRQDVMGVICVINRVDGLPLTERDQSLLQALADQASVSIYYAQFRSALEEKRRMDRDLNLAMKIQMGLLPRALPEVPGLTMHAFNLPALEVGGDYYDVIRVDDTHLGFAIADVSGKGIGGAIMMSICRSVLRAQALHNTDPAEVLRAVNRTMSGDLYEDMFVTMVYMVYNVYSKELAIARAGHDPPLILLGGTGEVLRDFSGGLALGLVDPDTFDATIESTRLVLPPDTLVLTYTDGITEAMNEQGEEWGLRPVVDILTSSSKLSPERLLHNIKERVLRFTGDLAQYDDMTVLAMRTGPQTDPAGEMVHEGM